MNGQKNVQTRIMLGLTQQNTGGFAFAQLLPNTSGAVPARGMQPARHELPAELERARRASPR